MKSNPSIISLQLYFCLMAHGLEGFVFQLHFHKGLNFIAGDFTQLKTVVLSEFCFSSGFDIQIISVLLNDSIADHVNRAPHSPFIQATFPLAPKNLTSIIELT